VGLGSMRNWSERNHARFWLWIIIELGNSGCQEVSFDRGFNVPATWRVRLCRFRSP
jgi:hypothetical protein